MKTVGDIGSPVSDETALEHDGLLVGLCVHFMRFPSFREALRQSDGDMWKYLSGLTRVRIRKGNKA